VNRQLGVAILMPTEPAIALFVGAWAYVLVLRARWRFPREPLFYAMVAQLAWMGICVIPSTSFRLSIAQTISTAGFVAVGALFPMFEIRSLERIEAVIRVYLIFGILLSLYGIAQIVASPLPFDRAATFVGAGLLSNHGPYAAFLGFALGPAFVYTLMSPLDRRATLPIVCGVLTLVATVLSLTRAAWLATAALLLVFGISKTRTFLRSLGVPLLATTLLTVLAIASVPNAKASLERFLVTSVSSRNVSNLERINRWAAGFRMIVRNPVVGVGPGAFEAAYPDYRDVEFVTVQSEKNMGAHSDMIRAASEQGLPGLLVLGILVVVFYRTGLRLMRHPELRIRRLAAALCAGVFTYTVHSLFNEYWRFTKVAISLWLFVGLLGALARFVDAQGGSPSGDAVARPGES
jgi:O-antigen ligase